jgi:hypothetical protein
VLAQVGVEHNLDNHLSRFSVHFPRKVAHDVAVVIFKHDVEGGGQMVVLEDAVVRVSDCQRMLGSDDELIGVARVLVVVDNVRDEHGEDVKAFDLSSQVASSEEVVHRLQRVHNMERVMVRVLLEVAECNLLGKVEDSVHIDVVLLKELVLVKDLVGNVRQTVLLKLITEVERIEVDLLNVLDCLGQLILIVGEVSDLEELVVGVFKLGHDTLTKGMV